MFRRIYTPVQIWISYTAWRHFLVLAEVPLALQVLGGLQAVVVEVHLQPKRNKNVKINKLKIDYQKNRRNKKNTIKL